MVELGDVVTMDFIGSFLDGVEFESTRDGEPMEFEIGAGKVVKGIENMVRLFFFTYSSMKYFSLTTLINRRFHNLRVTGP